MFSSHSSNRPHFPHINKLLWPHTTCLKPLWTAFKDLCLLKGLSNQHGWILDPYNENSSGKPNSSFGTTPRRRGLKRDRLWDDQWACCLKYEDTTLDDEVEWPSQEAFVVSRLVKRRNDRKRMLRLNVHLKIPDSSAVIWVEIWSTICCFQPAYREEGSERLAESCHLQAYNPSRYALPKLHPITSPRGHEYGSIQTGR